MRSLSSSMIKLPGISDWTASKQGPRRTRQRSAPTAKRIQATHSAHSAATGKPTLPRPRHAKPYSASSSSYRHSPAEPFANYGRASCGFLQRGQPAHGSGELTVDLRSRLRRMARGEAIEHLAEAFLGQILISVLPDQRHRGVDAGAETLDFFPAETAILGQMEWFVVDPALAHLDEIARSAQAARRRAADLDVRLLADRLQLKHRVERRDFERADVGHAKQIRDRPDRRFRNPPVMLLLDAPQDRDDGRGLSAIRKFGDLLLCPGKIFRREGEACGLKFLGREAADGHCIQSLIACGAQRRRSRHQFDFARTHLRCRTRYSRCGMKP